MGTRGLYGFYVNGVSKLTYNHVDSDPDCLGKDMVSFIKRTPINRLKEIASNIVLIEQNSAPSIEQINELKSFFECIHEPMPEYLGIGSWYSILKGFQGSVSIYEEGLKYMIDNSNFIHDSLFCEWGYVINLDENIFEVYEGFQKKNSKSRYVCIDPRDGYYQCKLVATYPLANIPDNWIFDVDPERDFKNDK